MITSLMDDPEKIKAGWMRIFSEFGYLDRINKLSAMYPEEKSLYVSFRDISEYGRSNGFDQGLAEDPELFISLGEDVLKEMMRHDRGNVTRINLRITDISEDPAFRKEIRQLRSPDIGKLLSITGIIRKNTEVLPRLQIAAFECSVCGEINLVHQERGKLDEPQECQGKLESGLDHSKAKFKLKSDLSEFVDTQKVELQENPETLEGGTQPQRIAVIMEDDITGRLFPGDRVTIDGILRAEQKRAGNIMLTEYDIFFYALHYKKSKELEEINISTEDEEKIVELSCTSKAGTWLFQGRPP